MSNLVYFNGDRAVTNSFAIASGTNVQHHAVLQLLRKYPDEFNTFGRVAFEMQPFETNGGTQTREVAILNEQHATLLLTFMKNNEFVRKFKVRLVAAFYELKRRNEEVGWIKHHMTYEIHQAVSKRAGKDYEQHKRAYKAIQQQFKIERVDQLPPHRLEECLKLVENVDLMLLEADKGETKKDIVLPQKAAEQLRNFVWYWKYLYRPQLETVLRFLNAVDSPMAGGFHAMTYCLTLGNIEHWLRNNGYPMEDLPQYRELLIKKAREKQQRKEDAKLLAEL